MIQLWSKNILSFILSVLFVVSMFALPLPASAGDPGIEVPITDDAHDRLIGYWDLRDRETTFQVTNTSGANVDIHIQIYDVDSGCAEFDYSDTMTPRDTHIYNVRELDRNNGLELAAPDLSDSHGIIAVSVTDITQEDDNVLTGNFRIFDNAGYEYRTNLAGEGLGGNNEDEYEVNFNNVDGSSFADLVVITYNVVDGGDAIFPTTKAYDIELFDENENPISCPSVVLGCLPDALGQGNLINVGINQAITNSRGGPSLCLGNDTTGHLELDVDEILVPFENGDDAEGAIFLGLNNGNSTGSIDHAIAD